MGLPLRLPDQRTPRPRTRRLRQLVQPTPTPRLARRPTPDQPRLTPLWSVHLEEWAELREGDAYTTLGSIDDVFDVVFLDAEKEDYEALFHLARRLVEPGGVIVADNVLSHAEHLAAYSRARQADPTLSSLIVPLDRGLELSVVLSRAG